MKSSRFCFISGPFCVSCDASLEDMVRVNVYLTDMNDFHDMNFAYLDVIPFGSPSRITVGVSALALGASVGMDCVAYKL